MKTKFISALSALAIGTAVLAFSASAASTAAAIRIESDAGIVKSDVAPYLLKGTTLVPLNVITKVGIDGINVSWDNKTKTAAINKKNTVIKLTVNNAAANLGDKQVKLEVPPTLKDGRVMVPLRFISESTGMHVTWNTYTRTILISAKPPEKAPTEPSYLDPVPPLDNLSKARAAAIALPEKNSLKDLESIGLMRISYYFPVGESDRYIYGEDGLYYYYEIHDKQRVRVWEVTYDPSRTADNKGLPFLNYEINKEVGERPDFKTDFVFYDLIGAIGNTEYGIIRADGTKDKIGIWDSKLAVGFPAIQEEKALKK